MTQIKELITKSKTIAIFFHINPDGDAIGSSLALKYGLEQLNKNAVVFSADKVSEKFNMFNLNDIETKPKSEKFDLGIVLDCPDVKRIGQMCEALKQCNNVINIDHHLNNSNFADVTLCDEKASSTCELIFKLLKELNVELTSEISKCLYVGLATDTGSFMFNISKDLHIIANELVKKVSNIEKLTYNLFRQKTKDEVLFYAEIIKRLEFYIDNRLAITHVNLKDLSNFNLDAEVTSGLIFMLSGLANTDVICVICEEKFGQYKVAFRSNTTDVCSLASSFGGGGHKFASGCKIYGTKNNVKKNIIEKTKAYLCTE